VCGAGAYPDELNTTALLAGATTLRELAASAEASGGGMSELGIASLAEALGVLTDANVYANSAANAAAFTPPPPLPPSTPPPTLPPPADPASGDVGSGSGVVETASPSPPPSTSATEEAEAPLAATHETLRAVSSHLLAAGRSFASAASSGWVYGEERLFAPPALSLAASAVAMRLTRSGCSPADHISFAAHALSANATAAPDAVLVELAASAVCDANGRANDGRGAVSGGNEGAATALRVARLAGIEANADLDEAVSSHSSHAQVHALATACVTSSHRAHTQRLHCAALVHLFFSLWRVECVLRHR
jgi:hypothetical protein